MRCFLIDDPRACGCAHNPPRCVSTPRSEKEKTCEGTTVPHGVVNIKKKIKDVSRKVDKNLGSILILQAALLVLAIYYVGEFFLSERGPIPLFSKYIPVYIYFVFLHYHGLCICRVLCRVVYLSY